MILNKASTLNLCSGVLSLRHPCLPLQTNSKNASNLPADSTIRRSDPNEVELLNKENNDLQSNGAVCLSIDSIVHNASHFGDFHKMRPHRKRLYSHLLLDYVYDEKRSFVK